MLKNFLVYHILWILLLVLVEVNCQLTSFKPSVSSRHTATLVDDKLYILAGFDLTKKSIKEFSFLDVSVPFDTRELSWQDLTSINMIPAHVAATSAKGGLNNDTLFLYGGYSTDPTMASVYTFDSQHIIWKTQTITGINAIRKCELTGVIDYNGKFYLWSGNTDDNILVNEMLILDTINLSWRRGSLVNAPSPRCNYGATLLPNNKIIYMGGADDNALFDQETLNIINGTALALNEVYIYDTINDSWNTKVTLGNIPSNRLGFSTVLGLDGQKVIIYGGIFINPGYSDTTLYVLDLSNYNWYIPKISGKIPNPRAFHKANLIGKYMVISFGVGYDKTIESEILLLDISNNEEYKWTTKFDPKNNTTPPQPPPPPPPPNNMAGVIVGSLLSVISLSVGGFFIYKWNKNKQNQKTVNENNNLNNYSQEEKAIPTEKDHHDYEQVIDNNKQEIVTQMPRNENTTNYEPDHGQEIILTLKNENTTNHEPIIVPANDYHGQEDIGRLPSQILKDEILQAVKQEIATLKNEFLQTVRDNNFNITKNNAIQD